MSSFVWCGQMHCQFSYVSGPEQTLQQQRVNMLSSLHLACRLGVFAKMAPNSNTLTRFRAAYGIGTYGDRHGDPPCDLNYRKPKPGCHMTLFFCLRRTQQLQAFMVENLLVTCHVGTVKGPCKMMAHSASGT